MVLREGVGLSLLGVVIELGASTALTWLIKTMLYGVTANNSATFAVVTAIPFSVALIACCIPRAAPIGLALFCAFVHREDFVSLGVNWNHCRRRKSRQPMAHRRGHVSCS